MDKAWRAVTAGELRLSVELCAMYWHFLLMVWLIFFGLLLLTDPIVSDSVSFFDLSHSLTVSLYPPRLKMHHRGHRRNK